MNIRQAEINDIESLIELYMHHLTQFPPREAQHLELWIEKFTQIIKNKDYHILLGEINGQIVGSVTLIIIPNLTHNLRSYAIVENVVTHSDYRRKGYASRLLEKADEIAQKERCYKIMLMTGSKKDETLNFYRKNGYNSDDKTGFIKRFL